jgi:zinc transport system substrate-binding protein
VYAVNEPLRYFAERIGGGAVEAVLPCPAGTDPAWWFPDDTVIGAYQAADLILLNGAGYSAWVQWSSLPPSRLVSTSAGIEDRLIETDGSATHAHGPEGAHAHGRMAFTTWLDPTLAIAQATAVADAMTRRWPDDAAVFDAGLASLTADLESLDATLAASFADRPPVVFSHPVYQYLARRYGLADVSVHWEPDVAPTPAQWQTLEAILSDHPARVMIWEGEPLAETAGRLRAMGVETVVFDPGANTPDSGDWLGVMRANAQRLQE